MNPVERVRQALTAAGLDESLVRELPVDTGTAEAAAQAVGAPLGSIVKSLIFLLDGAPVLVLVAGDQRADVKQLRAVLGLSKKRLRIAQPGEVLALTGFEVGGVPPVGHTSPLRTLVDRTLGRFDTVWAAAGSAHAVFPIAYERLVTLTAGEVLDLADQPAAALENADPADPATEAELARLAFIDFVAHELKQPMTSIQGYARMLELGIGGELNDTQKQFVQVITSNAERLGRLVNDLLEISRLEAGRVRLELAPLQIRPVVDEAITRVQADVEARHHVLSVDVPTDLPAVLADRERLAQILTSLLRNACRYTPDGGTIRITAGERARPQLRPDHVLIGIRDTGIGLSPQDLARVGEKFFRASHHLVRSQPGIGLGLAIARRLVELHGGELTVESEPERGSTFSVRIPVALNRA
jgi:signal transduction histidine kinase